MNNGGVSQEDLEQFGAFAKILSKSPDLQQQIDSDQHRNSEFTARTLAKDTKNSESGTLSDHKKWEKILYVPNKDQPEVQQRSIKIGESPSKSRDIETSLIENKQSSMFDT